MLNTARCLMQCHYYCTIMVVLLLAPCFSQLTLQIAKCVINDSNSLEKKAGKCHSKSAWKLQESVKATLFFYYIVRNISAVKTLEIYDIILRLPSSW